jgi:uncharacterized protein (TIGR02246 family)
VTALETEVLKAAADLVAAFGTHDRDGYFAAFAPDATFLFHTTPGLLGSRAAYEAEWAGWEAGGFRVLSCVSRDQHVQALGDDIAAFTHAVLTRTRDGDGEHDLAERETIVFRREPDGRWLGVHEHLSPAP